MTLMAKDEYCMYCSGFHPVYLDGCPNIKQTKINIISTKKIEMIRDSIKTNCPHCGVNYDVVILREEDNFHVLCPDCKKFFKAKR
jgi:hypothetical protein